MLWTEKYKPKRISDLLIDDDTVADIDKWLLTHEDPLLFTGYPGTCKTETARVILNERNYQIKEINANDIKNNKSIKDVLTKSLNTQNIVNMFSVDRKKLAIIIDEIDTLIIGSDKSNLTELLQLISPAKKKDSLIKSPIICICNETSDKKISDLKKFCKEIVFPKIGEEQLYEVMHKIMAGEKMELSENIQKICVMNSIGDIRRLVIILNDINNLMKLDGMTEDMIFRLCETLSKKDLDVRLPEATHQILMNRSITIDECLLNYNYEKFLLPFMIHEHIPNAIEAHGKNVIGKMAKCLDILSENDVIQEYIYEKQAKKLNNYSGIYITYMPNHFINKDVEEDKEIPLTHSKLSNKFSQHRSNRKKINTIKNTFPVSLDEIYMLTEHIQYHLFNKKGDRYALAKMLREYKIEPEHIPMVLFVGNLTVDNTKKKYTTKIKRDFMRIYAELNSTASG